MIGAKGERFMLETRDLTKTYRPKKGVPVAALDHVSLRFPETGMVFLIGKSGSGKSTLLNLLGGLDRCDGGEIVIKGVSTRDFTQKHFDSYRNTYVGFIFQEYNVLEEFSVGANIALALELQGKRATDEELNRILREVDLEGYGGRRPNELSGGQKQRVAIARALVKNPEILLADEPTGALDSATGTQVLETLKRLSKQKLVIVVSHDRDFAMRYADRIIELADGRVVSDVEAAPQEEAEPAKAPTALQFEQDTVSVPAGYHLTEADRAAINAYIDRLSGALTLSLCTQSNERAFRSTDQTSLQTGDGSDFRLIRSRLPLKNAFRIGVGGLRHKKFRLAVTILLSCIAFGLFGLADAFGAYNHVQACTDSLVDTGVPYATVQKAVRYSDAESTPYEFDEGARYGITDEELSQIRTETGLAFRPVVTTDDSLTYPELGSDAAQFPAPSYFTGFAEIDGAVLDAMGYTLLAGTLPDGAKNEIAISEMVYLTISECGYLPADAQKAVKFQAPGDLVGKTLTLNGTAYTVAGVVKTDFDRARYASLMESEDRLTETEKLQNFVLQNELDSAVQNSYTGMAMVGTGGLARILAAAPKGSQITGFAQFWAFNESDSTVFDFASSLSPNYAVRLRELPADAVTWVDGEKTVLGEKELIVSADLLAGDADAKNGSTGSSAGTTGAAGATDYSALKDLRFDGFCSEPVYGGISSQSDYRIVGVFSQPGYRGAIAVDDLTFSKLTRGAGTYRAALAPMPADTQGVRALVSWSYRTGTETRYPLQSPVTYELDSIHEILRSLSRVFLYIGLGFAVFAAVMLSNFIATSISYKKQEIGILRAIGSRSNDVFRIFFAESFVIAAVNFLLAATGTGVVVAILNFVLRREVGVLITVLHFGLRQILLLLFVSMAVAALASFFPVRRAAAKRPIDAIRNR